MRVPQEKMSKKGVKREKIANSLDDLLRQGRAKKRLLYQVTEKTLFKAIDLMNNQLWKVFAEPCAVFSRVLEMSHNNA